MTTRTIRTTTRTAARTRRGAAARVLAALAVLVTAVLAGAGPAAAYVPDNDDFADARVLTEPVFFNESELTEGATAEPGEPDEAGRPPEATIWYRWTAPADVVVTSWSSLTLLSSNKTPGHALAFFTGNTLGNLHEVASDAGTQPTVTFTATAGTVYHIALNVAHKWAADGNTHLYLYASPPNDNFGHATVISGSHGSAPGYVATATLQRREGQHSLFQAYGGTVWYDWTAPSTGFSRFGVECCAGNQPTIAVYTGPSMRDLHAVSSGFSCNAGAFNACTTFHHVAGTTYHIVVTGDGTTFPLKWAQVAASCSIEGTPGDDVLVGTPRADYICGLGGDDVISGLAGDDVVVGGAGADRVDYSDARLAVEVDLTQAAGFGVGADTLQSVEDVTGSAFDDRLTGDSGNNRISGGDGRDLIWGHRGNDRLDGGAGIDVVAPGRGRDKARGGHGTDELSYDQAPRGVEVDLLAGVTHGEGKDRVSGFEDVQGSAYADHLVGDNHTNVLFGGAAGDLLEGRSGDDTLYGQDGGDDLRGGHGLDACHGGHGKDTASGCE